MITIFLVDNKNNCMYEVPSGIYINSKYHMIQDHCDICKEKSVDYQLRIMSSDINGYLCFLCIYKLNFFEDIIKAVYKK